MHVVAAHVHVFFRLKIHAAGFFSRNGIHVRPKKNHRLALSLSGDDAHLRQAIRRIAECLQLLFHKSRRVFHTKAHFRVGVNVPAPGDDVFLN